MITGIFYMILVLLILSVCCLVDWLISVIPGAGEALDRWIMRNIVK